MFHRDVDDVAPRKSRPTAAQARANAWVERHHRRRTLSLSDIPDRNEDIVKTKQEEPECANLRQTSAEPQMTPIGTSKDNLVNEVGGHENDIVAADVSDPSVRGRSNTIEQSIVGDEHNLQVHVGSISLDDGCETKVGVGIFSKDDIQLLSELFQNHSTACQQNAQVAAMEESDTGADQMMPRDVFVGLLCQFLGNDLQRDPQSYASRLFDSFTHTDSIASARNGLDFEQLVRGLAAMDPHAPDTSDRLRYVFRVYATSNDDTSPAVLWFRDFKLMLRDILCATGNLPCEDTDNNSTDVARGAHEIHPASVHEQPVGSVHEQATALFVQSGLSVETGFITESVFVAACLNGSFHGPGALMRLRQRATVLYSTTNQPAGSAGADKMEISPPTPCPPVVSAPRAESQDPTQQVGTVGAAPMQVAEFNDDRESAEPPKRKVSPAPPRYQVRMAHDVTFDALASGPHPTEALRKIAEMRLTPTRERPDRWAPGDTPSESPGGGLEVGKPPQLHVLHPHAPPTPATPPHLAPSAPAEPATPPHVASPAALVAEAPGSAPHDGHQQQQSGPPPAPPTGALLVRVRAMAARVLDTILHPNFNPPPQQLFGFPDFSLLSAEEMSDLFTVAAHIVLNDDMVVPCRAPARIFGDIHGQLPDMLHFFHTFGLPHHRRGDVHLINYVFVGDFVDRGSYSLEVLVTLLCLKTCYPASVFLIRGNHEDREMNEHFGFLSECRARVRGGGGDAVWAGANAVFDNLPVAAVLEGKILCVHGGIGATFEKVSQLAAVPRPLPYPVRGPHAQLMRDVLWSDPTANDEVLGLRCNLRGEDMVEFGPDRVLSFLEHNQLDLIIRAHQCVQRGYEFFAGQHLITVFSATNYCGRHDNDGAILSVSRDLNVNFHVITHRERRRYSLWAQPQNSTPPQNRRRSPDAPNL